MRITQDQIDQLYTADVVDQSDETVGGVGQVYVDDNTGAPAWVSVKTGFFGTKETLVPLANADYDDGRIRVPYEKSYVKDAPNIDADQHLNESDQDELYGYYGLQGQVPTTGRTDVGGGVVGEGYAADTGRQREDAFDDRSDLAYDDTTRNDTGDRMTLHEERVDVGTERVETGRVRLRKHVVRDQETVTVPVEREEVEIVREPVSGEARGGRADLGEDELEVAVHEERPVIDKDVVATEEVGVERRTVGDERDVTTDVAHEEVEVVEDDTRRRDADAGRRD